MNILDKIVADKRLEVDAKKSVVSIDVFKHASLFDRPVNSLKKALIDGSGIIAEYKRRSPSKDVINHRNTVIEVSRGYEQAGASGISVLTDSRYFGGSLDDLLQARATVKMPVLRKDFMIDPYQFYEAKAYGADVILLIAAVLTDKEISEFSALARELRMEVLLEVHNLEELERSDLQNVDMIGVNNRDLKTFQVSLEASKELSDKIPDKIVKVSESGISQIEAITELKRFGYQGFLIGENFMKSDDPMNEIQSFINRL